MYLSLVWAALCNLLYFALHVTYSGSFPKPLTPRQERECLEKIRQGDLAAKNMLIEHNLRLVAHIVKKYTPFPGSRRTLFPLGPSGLLKRRPPSTMRSRKNSPPMQASASRTRF